MKWIKDRVMERTSWDGVWLIATGAVLVIAPTTLVGYAAIVYGVYTLLKSED